MWLEITALPTSLGTARNSVRVLSELMGCIMNDPCT